MFYLVLRRGLEKLSLARKHVLSENELPEASTTIDRIINVAMDRLTNLRSEPEKPGFPTLELTRFLDIFKLQNLEAKEQFEIFAKGLVCTFALAIRGDTDYTRYMKYNTPSAPGALLEGDQL